MTNNIDEGNELNGQEVSAFNSHDETVAADVPKEIELAAREFIENELRAAAEEVAPITQEVRSELKDIDELLYDQIRKEEEAELKAVLERNTVEDKETTEEQTSQNDVAVSEQTAAVLEEDQVSKGALVEERAERDQTSEVKIPAETEKQNIVPQEDKNISSNLTNDEQAEQGKIIEEKRAEIASEIVNNEERLTVEDPVPVEKKTEVSDEAVKPQVALECEEKAVPNEQNAVISSSNESELKATTEQVTRENEPIDLNNLDPDEYEIEEYEVEVEEGEDVGDEIIIVDENEPGLDPQSNKNVPSE